MSIILKRLDQSFGLALDPKMLSELKPASLKDALSKKIEELSREQRESLILYHTQILLEYTLQSSQIAKQLSKQLQGSLQRDDISRIQAQLIILIQQAAFLEVIYQKYLDSPMEVLRLQEEQSKLQMCLGLTIRPFQSNRFDFTHFFNHVFCTYNLPRLFGSRSKKLLLALTLITEGASTYSSIIKAFDRYAGPFFTHLSWIFFIPRLSTTLAMIIKHTISQPWMTQTEKELGWALRLRIQLNLRWPELSNDLPWFIANLATTFVLIGNLAPYAIVLTIIMQFYEIIQSTTQWYLETNQILQQLKLYEELRPQDENFIKELNTRYQFENARLWIPVWNTTVLLLALILAIPPLTAISPLFPIAGGLISVATTIVSYQKREAVKREMNPTQNLFSLLPQYTLFRLPSSDSIPEAVTQELGMK